MDLARTDETRRERAETARKFWSDSMVCLSGKTHRKQKKGDSKCEM